MQRTLATETIKKIGSQVTVSGWVACRRDHGKLIFLDLRDASGLLQIVVNPQVSQDAHKIAEGIRGEFVIRVNGKVNARPEKLINKKLPTGTVEMEALSIEILSESNTLPFELDKADSVNEEMRLKYRYLDLRRPEMLVRFQLRHKIIKLIRDFLSEHDFLEIETPILTKSTPEGARDYVVPSRMYPGSFYALPQSPQQYKQLLMVAGFEKYFQIARCFRDEDTRGDRQPEFTQLDLEMSFVEREDVMEINERLLIEIVQKLCPQKQIQEIPFPRLSYKQAMEKYGTDRPDLRRDKSDPNLLAFCWIIDFPFFEKTEGDGWTFTHNPFSAPKPEFMADLLAKRNIPEIITSQYDVALNGLEIGGGSIRNHRSDALQAVFEIMGYEKSRIQNNFGHMLEAFKYGTPPHGGIAWGLDRFVMLLADQPNIREVIAFPKTGDARDPMMMSPAPLEEAQMKELYLRTDLPKKK